MRHWLFGLALLLVGVAPAVAAPLSQADLEELRERLRKLTEGAGVQLDQRVKIALDDFRAAMQDETTTLDLYYKCVEKAHFTENHKKSQDFRDWKRDNEEKHKDSHFKQALRHQLNWLCLALRASIRPDDKEVLTPELHKAMRDLFSNAEALEGQFSVLNQGVRGSVFFVAYELGEMKAAEWPDSPMQVDAVFDTILMPPLRAGRSYTELSTMWDERIKMELAKSDLQKEKAEKAVRKGLVRPGQLKGKALEMQESTLQQLLWLKHVDLFKAGDEKNAALALLKHVQQYIGNAQAKQWTEEFQALITPAPEPLKEGQKTADKR